MNIDTSPAATRRRGLKFFHGVALVMGGGAALVRPGPWLLVAAAVWLATVAWSARRYLPANTAAVTQLGTQITELYAAINRTNAEIESRQHPAEAVPPKPQQDEPPRPPA